jgi:hypothetical protein
LAAWFQGLYGGKSVPVLVGGAAVELYTGGAYTTGDLDFVGAVPDSVARNLAQAGFRKEGRHWIHERGQVFIELPGSSLQAGETTALLEVGGDRILTVGPEALIVDRLASWKFWKVRADGINAYLIWKARNKELDLKLLAELARARDLADALDSLRGFVRILEGREASQPELEKWASTLA